MPLMLGVGERFALTNVTRDVARVIVLDQVNERNATLKTEP